MQRVTSRVQRGVVRGRSRTPPPEIHFANVPSVKHKHYLCIKLRSSTAMTDDSEELLAVPQYFTIDTDRLHLRTLHVSDAEAVLPLISYLAVMRWTSQPPVKTISQAEQWLKARALGLDVFNFAIHLRKSTTVQEGNTHDSEPIIGIMGSFHWPRIGYLIHPGTLLPLTFTSFL